MTTLTPALSLAAPPKRLWLITFVDLVMLLLAFFVLMFSMSRVDGARFGAMAESYGAAFGTITDLTPGPTRVPQKARVPGDDLAYLEAVLKAAFARESDLAHVQFHLTAQYLMLDLPLGAAGEEGDTLDEATRQQVFKIGGVLTNLPNRVVVVVPAAGEPARWQRARRQAEIVRDALGGAGYPRPLAALVRGTEVDSSGETHAQIFVMPETEASP